MPGGEPSTVKSWFRKTQKGREGTRRSIRWRRASVKESKREDHTWERPKSSFIRPPVQTEVELGKHHHHRNIFKKIFSRHH